MSPALAGSFFTTEPSRKPTDQELKEIHVCIGAVGLCRQTMLMSKAREEGIKKTAVLTQLNFLHLETNLASEVVLFPEHFHPLRPGLAQVPRSGVSISQERKRRAAHSSSRGQEGGKLESGTAS